MANFKKILSRFLVILRNLGFVVADPERKSFLRMCFEFLLCSVANRCFATHYLTSYLYRKDVNNILDYIPIKEERQVQEKINDPRVSDIVTNKLYFLEFFKQGGFKVPRLLGYNLLDKFYFLTNKAWETAELSSIMVFKYSLEHIMKNSRIDSIFLKEIRGNSGIGAYLVSMATLDTKLEIENVYKVVRKNSYVFQEVVVQHPDLSRLNPTSLNTIRIDTFRLPGKNAEILSAFIRVGGKGKNVDNVGSGGVLVSADLETGKLREKGFNFFHGSQQFGTFLESPATGYTFDGFQIPYFNDVKETVVNAAEWIPPSLVGWDVAVGPTEPILIEANLLYYGLRSSDMAYGGYRKNPVYRKAIDYVKKLQK